MNDTKNKEKNSLEFPSKNNHLPNADKDSKDLPHGKMHIHSAEEMRPYIEDAESVKRSSSDIVKDERRIFGHFHNSSLPADAHNPKGISFMTNEECDYCGKELDQCHCDLLYKRQGIPLEWIGLYGMCSHYRRKNTAASLDPLCSRLF